MRWCLVKCYKKIVQEGGGVAYEACAFGVEAESVSHVTCHASTVMRLHVALTGR